MNEPLKDKRLKISSCDSGYYHLDIKSAVEWYIEQYDKPTVYPFNDNVIYQEWVKSESKVPWASWLILRAFEDVTKSKQGED